jgi:hypothetical protein
MKGGGVKLGHKRKDIQKYQAKNINLLKTLMSNLVYTTRFWNNFDLYNPINLVTTFS